MLSHLVRKMHLHSFTLTLQGNCSACSVSRGHHHSAVDAPRFCVLMQLVQQHQTHLVAVRSTISRRQHRWARLFHTYQLRNSHACAQQHSLAPSCQPCRPPASRGTALRSVATGVPTPALNAWLAGWHVSAVWPRTPRSSSIKPLTHQCLHHAPATACMFQKKHSDGLCSS